MIPIQYVVLKYINDQQDPLTSQPLYPVSMTEDAKTTILLFDHALTAHPLSIYLFILMHASFDVKYLHIVLPL